MLSSGDTFIVTNKVEQTKYFNKIYPKSVNPLRIMVFRNADTGKLDILSAQLRIGCDKSAPVSNGAKGGLTSKIEINSGRLTKAYQYVESYRWYIEHPNTSEVIEGRLISEWEGIKNSIESLLGSLGWVDWAGLDIAVTSSGIKVLEINSLPGLYATQIFDGGLLDRPNVVRFLRSKGLPY